MNSNTSEALWTKLESYLWESRYKQAEKFFFKFVSSSDCQHEWGRIYDTYQRGHADLAREAFFQALTKSQRGSYS